MVTGSFYDPMPVVIDCIKKMAYISAALAFCFFWNTFFWTLVGTRVENRMKLSMFSNLMKSEVSYFDVTPIGNILTLLSEDAEAIQISFGMVKATQFSAVTQGITGLVFAFINCWQVAFVSIAFIPVVAIALLCIIPPLMKNSAIKFKYISQSMTIAEETLGSIRTVRGFCRENVESKRFMKATKEGAKRDRNIGLLIVVFLFVVLISVVADMLGDFYYGATFVDKGKLKFGELTTLFMYTMLGSMGVVSLQGTMQGEEKCLAAGARILEVAEHVPDIPFDGGDIIEDFKGEIEFKNVSFKYPTRDAYVLKNVSFTIKPKQIGALVGHSGSGKSTCVQLLERFYDASEGLVLLDGHDIRTLDQHWLHKKIALVSQEPVLFRKSLRDNIKYGAHDATDEEILAAIEIANAKRVLDKLENGLDTLVGDKGSSLSGGQRQRIAIARAVIKKPTILITDEATSALDAQSEKKVQVALDKVMEDCTSVIVAHRLSTIRNANIIYVFDAGEIKESGTHEELVKKGGYYYNLVYRQLTEKDEQAHQNAIKKEQSSSSSEDESSSDHNDVSEVSTSSSSSSTSSSSKTSTSTSTTSKH
ncbi:ABC transporter family protein [Tritrichomonas foetus]|uniref:ABC transporter family protein n=1 Tax=Tritrichomonas foetus TaxID=1144522 RepID=A0A1J4KUD8_9EUKA|nr:ABC transporter family protein [Tritrichomonas foetus]|eukprot:OHT14754.1 ABC transporter family protein [Tritrichomonas foetus]